MNKNYSKSNQLPGWLWANSATLPPLYRAVWDAVREDKSSVSQGEILVDTDKVFSLLLTTQLSMDILGHIWNIANRKYAGQLTEQELYVVLALVAVAQSSCAIESLDVLRSLSFPVIPYLNLDRLPRSRPAVPSNASAKFPVHISETTANVVNLPNQIDLRSHNSQNKSKVKGNSSKPYGFNIDVPVSSSILERDFCLDPKVKVLATSPVSTLQFLPQISNVQHTAVIESDPSDEFSEFQSAPLPPAPPPPPPLPNAALPSVQIWDGKQGSAIGSRLANHNLGVKKVVDRSRKTANTSIRPALQSNLQSNIHLQNVSSMNLFLQNCNDKDLMATGQCSELFPKCAMKSHSKTVILRDTAIRSANRVGDVAESHTCFSTTVIDPVNDDRGTPAVKPEIHAKVTDRKQQEVSKKDLMSVQHMEDKYSALREFIRETSSKSAQASEDGNNMADEFGEFVSAKISDTVQAPSVDALADTGTDIFTTSESLSHENHADTSNVADLHLTFGISETLDNLKLSDAHDEHSEVMRFDSTPEVASGKAVHKEDSISVNSIELSNGTPGILTRSGSVPSLDLKSFLPPSSDEEQIIDSNHQTMYWEWKHYMESCVLLLQVAANIFTSITTEAVLEEVLNSAQGYYFLCNLAEVAAVCRRVNFSYKEMDICIMGFDELLMDIDRIWAEMEPFYINIPIVTELPAWPLHQGEAAYCSLCLTVISSRRVIHNENSYHATCANLWLRCVSNHLPVMKYPLFYSQSAMCPVSSHL